MSSLSRSVPATATIHMKIPRRAPLELDRLKRPTRLGAILDDRGTMVGSALIMEFRAALSWNIGSDGIPTLPKVWQRTEIKPFRLAVLDGKITP